MKTQLSILTVIVVVLANVIPTFSPSVVNRPCVPGATDRVATYSVAIDLGQSKLLYGKFFYPKPGLIVNYDEGSLPGVMLSHGYGQTYAAVEAQAKALAENCMVALVFNWFGHGQYDWEITTTFDMYSAAERDNLGFIIDRLKSGPIEGSLDLVDNTRLGMMSYSQSGIANWLALSDNGLRDNFLAFAPSDAGPSFVNIQIPNGCLNANIANVIDPTRVRTPVWTPGNPTPTEPAQSPTPWPRVVWDATTYPSLYDAYINTNVPVWEAALATRNFPVTQLAQVTAGTPHPHTYIQSSWYDAIQLVDVAITPWATLTTATPVNTPTSQGGQATPTPKPSNYHQMRIGAGGHSNGVWEGDLTEQAYGPLSKIGWLRSQLEATFVASATPSPTPNGGGLATVTPTRTPYPVEYVVDYYSALGTPVFATQQSTIWPPVPVNNTQAVKLYFNANGVAKLATPPSGSSNYDTVKQTLVPGSSYNQGTAVAEDPKYATWATEVVVSSQTYSTAVLHQDVTLYGPPIVELFTNANNAGTGTASVLIWEVYSNGTRDFVTRADVCDWSTSSVPGELQGAPLTGKPRFHTFKAGRRIMIEITTVDPDFYRQTAPVQNMLYITPRLATYSFQVNRGKNSERSNVLLYLMPSSPGDDIFESDGLMALDIPETGRKSVVEEEATPEPLSIQAALYPDTTNPGGWRAWTTEVWFYCSGGQGPVTCPQDQLLMSDGENQSFTYEAHDDAGSVVSVTVSGLNIDRTPPGWTETLPEAQTFCLGATTQLNFSVSDALSGLSDDETLVTWNEQTATANQYVPLTAGVNTLSVYAQDVAGNGITRQTTVQVNYNTALDFPSSEIPIMPNEPLPFKFAIADSCSEGGKYGGATGTLWLVSPGGVEQPAQWVNGTPGNTFTYDSLLRQYYFDADVSGLTFGTWTAKLRLDDGNTYTSNFTVP